MVWNYRLLDDQDSNTKGVAEVYYEDDGKTPNGWCWSHLPLDAEDYTKDDFLADWELMSKAGEKPILVFKDNKFI